MKNPVLIESDTVSVYITLCDPEITVDDCNVLGKKKRRSRKSLNSWIGAYWKWRRMR